MGLDSVELIMDIEEHFNINIADQDAENITTVQDLTDLVAQILHISNEESSVANDVLNTLNQILIKNNQISTELNFSDFIFQIISSGKENLKTVESQLSLKLPKIQNHQELIGRLFPFVFSPLIQRDKITVEQFIQSICAINHTKLFPSDSITDKFQIRCIVIALTADKCGINELHIRPDSRITSDLGIN
ncbi:MAG: hypothetical protein GC181_10515 [Bacteroidetes bacterium]|nr:hypothetical protein [Bacteroidota bacterium]